MLKRYIGSITLIAVSILLMLGFILVMYYATEPNRKPAPTHPQPGPQADKKYNWYIQFSVKQQKSTAYTEEPGAPVAANGQDYFIGGIAVHPQYPVGNGGKPTMPIIPFGTVIHLEKPIKVQGTEYKTMTVIDTGDVNYRLWPSHPYWFDVYFGSTNYYNSKSAREYGASLVNYYWYEPWP